MTPKELPEIFAQALTSGHFSEAAAMLSVDLRVPFSEELLEEQYKEMIEYGDGSAEYVELVRYEFDWPQKESKDIAWAYVAIVGNGFSEGIAVVVANEENKCVIKSIEWGRP
jgi:hypothetical protein